jgi:multidrug transporter EmrE-like cation transporter
MPVAFLLEFGFGQLFKWAQQRGCHVPAALAVNYLTLSTLLGIFFLARSDLSIQSAVLEVGLVTGTCFIIAMLIMTTALSLVRVGTVLTAFRMAMLIPIAASVLIWGETASPLQALGIVLALAALVLMTRTRADGGSASKMSRLGQMALIFMVFCGQGGSMTCLRWVRYAGLEDQLLKVIMVTGFTAGALGTVFLLVRRIRPSRTDISMGVLIGVYNLIALIALLTALNHVPGTVFFPLLGCTVVTLDNLAAHFFWQERLDRAAFLGVGLALTAILIVT